MTGTVLVDVMPSPLLNVVIIRHVTVSGISEYIEIQTCNDCTTTYMVVHRQWTSKVKGGSEHLKPTPDM